MSEKSSLDKLANMMNADYITNSSPTEIVSAVNTQLEVIKETKENTLQEIKQNQFGLKDKEYLEEKIKKLIQLTEDNLDKLSSDIRIGAHPRMYEVLATLANSMILQVKELRELNKMIMDTDLLNDPVDQNKLDAKVTINVTGKELLEIYKEKQKQMDAINTEFDIED